MHHMDSDNAWSLNDTLCVSEGEIWCSGYYATFSGSWLVQANSKGETATQTMFPGAPGLLLAMQFVAQKTTIEENSLIGRIRAEIRYY